MNINELTRDELLKLKEQVDQKLNRSTIFLKKMISDNNLNYTKLAKQLNSKGIKENSKNLSNKIQKGKFSFEFVLQVAEILDKEIIVIDKKKKD